ncbi:hypothetical protein VPH35_030932 [Triticum aestivum]
MELSTATLMSISVASLAILVSLLRRKSAPSSKRRRPPGPRCLPFIGSLLHLLTSEPQVALRDLAKKHGPVMYLRLGHVDTVVISSPAAAQEVLRDNSLTFASRPSLLVTEILCYGNTDIAFAPYGAYWRTLRKICMVELLSARKVRQFAPIRDTEILSLVRNVRAAARGGEPVNLGGLLVSCSNTISAKATFGEGCDADLQEQFLSAIGVALEYSGGFGVGDLFPSLWFVDVVTGVRRRLWRAHRVPGAAGGEEVNGDDLLSVMLRIKDEDGLEFPISTTNIKAIIVDMFTGGTETTSSAAEWIMSELMRNPEVIAKAQAEVRQTLDNKNPRDQESLIEGLCYTRMVVKEGLRLHPVLPLLLPRVCRETCDVGGFEVTEGTRVMVNAWAIARSAEHWHDAEEFRPESSGRRMCPGGNFAMATLELTVARLLYYFDWSLPNGIRPEELDMDMIVGATARRRNQLHLIAEPYNVPIDL